MKIKFNNIKATAIHETEQEEKNFKALINDMKVMAPGAEYTYEYMIWKKTKGKKGWDGKVKIIDNSFHTGLLPEVQKLLWQTYKISPKLIDERAQLINNKKIVTLSLKDYQQRAFESCITNRFNSMWWPRGVIQLATGGGKTHIAMALYKYFNVPTLFLTHRKDLVNQTAERFKQFLGVTPSTMIEGDWNLNDPNITVATIQTLANLATDNPKFLSTIQQVIFDEAHLIAASLKDGNNFVKFAGLINNAIIRWGLTATPFMRDKYSNWLLKGVTGETLYSRSSQELIKTGDLTAPTIIIIQAPPIAKCPQSWPNCYDAGIVLNTERNELIIDQLSTIDKPCIIMCKQIAHANILQSYAIQKGYHIPILQGTSPTEQRDEVVNLLKTNKIDTIICTTIFDEGIDIPELKSIILAGAGRSGIKHIQRIGRLLRTAEGKHKATVIDFNDTCSKILQRHSKERINICKEQGFEINIP